MKKRIGSSRNNNIGIIHFVAALFVLYGHQYALLCDPNVPVLFSNPIQSIGVKSIFVISGYLITKSLFKLMNDSEKYCIKYVVKRLSRIYPELIGCLIFCALIIGPFFSRVPLRDYLSNNVWLEYICRNILMTPMYSLFGVFELNPYQNAVNGSLWTMPIEILLYLIVLVLGALGKDKDRAKGFYTGFTLLLVIAQVLKLVLLHGHTAVFWGTDWLQAMDIMPYFMIGATYFFWPRDILNVEVSAILLFVFSSVSYRIPALNEFLCMLILPYFVLSVGLSDYQGLKVFGHIKPEYSYGIYLYGFPIQQSIIKVVYIDNYYVTNLNILFVLSAILSYLAAAISYNCLYLPFTQNVLKPKAM